MLAIVSILLHALHDLTGKILRVILSKPLHQALQYYAFR